VAVSTLRVVGMNTAGPRPTAAFGGPVAVRLKVMEPVLVSVPVTPPDAVQTPPMRPTQGTPASPLLVGGVLVGVSATDVRVSGWIVGVAVAVSACTVAVCTTAVCVPG